MTGAPDFNYLGPLFSGLTLLQDFHAATLKQNDRRRGDAAVDLVDSVDELRKFSSAVVQGDVALLTKPCSN